MTNLTAELETRGFTKHGTGGNCFAYIRQNTDGTSDWITNLGGDGEPEEGDWAWERYSTDNRTVEGDVIDHGDSDLSPVDLVSLIDLDPR